MSPAELYEQDFYEWTVRNAELLRSGRASEADLEHVAEEIEDMGNRQKSDLLSRLAVLMAHLLKWQIQPERRGRSWQATIKVQRIEIERLLRYMPSLRRFLAENLDDAYRQARVQASAETFHPEADFPETCPFTVEVLLDPEYLP